jgi:hypothetical protein
LIGGVASQTQAGFSLQFIILGTFFVIAIPAIALGAPETAFDRRFVVAQTPSTIGSELKTSFPRSPRRLISLETMTNYIAKLKPYAYSGSSDLSTLLQAPRASITPTTSLLALVSLLPYATLWGLTSSLSLLFPSSPSTLGTLFTGPWLLATATVAAATLLPIFLPRTTTTKLTQLTHNLTFTPKTHLATLAAGTALTFTALLTLGLHHSTTTTTTTTTTTLPLPTLSLLLGLLATGTYLLRSTTAPLIKASTAFTSSSLAVATQATADMAGGVTFWQTLAAGVFVLALPRASASASASAASSSSSFKGAWVGIAATLVVVAGLVGAVWWVWGEGEVKWGDGRVIRGVRRGDLEGVKRNGSFFEWD